MNSKNDQTTQTHLNNLWTADRALQNQAYGYIMEATSEPVDWAYYELSVNLHRIR